MNSALQLKEVLQMQEEVQKRMSDKVEVFIMFDHV